MPVRGRCPVARVSCFALAIQVLGLLAPAGTISGADDAQPSKRTLVTIGRFENLGSSAGRFGVLESSLPDLVRAGLLGNEDLDVGLEEPMISVQSDAALREERLSAHGSSEQKSRHIFLSGNFVEYKGSVRVEITVRNVEEKSTDTHLAKVLGGSNFLTDLDGLVADLRHVLSARVGKKPVKRLAIGCFQGKAGREREKTRALAADLSLSLAANLATSKPLIIDQAAEGACKDGDLHRTQEESFEADAVLAGRIRSKGDKLVVEPVLRLSKGDGEIRLLAVTGSPKNYRRLEAALVRQVGEVLNALVNADGSWNAKLLVERGPSDYLEDGRAALREESSWDLAAVLLEHAVEEAPRDTEAHYQLGLARIAQQRGSDAIGEFQEALKIEPHNSKTLIGLGDAALSLSDYQSATRYYSQALAISPVASEEYRKLGEAYLLDQKTNQASSALQKAAQLDPENPRIRVRLGDVYRIMDSTNQAVEEYRKARELDPGNRDAQRGLEALTLARSRQLIKEGKLSEAANVLSEQISDDSSDEVYSWLSFVLNSLERFQEMEALGDRFALLGKRNASVENNFAYTLDQLGKPEKAVEHYRRGLEMQPKDAVISVNEADLLDRLGRFEEAAAILDNALFSTSADLNLSLMKARVLADQGDDMSALAVLDKVGDPDEPNSLYRWYLSRGYVLDSELKFSDAIAWFDKAILLDPKMWTAYNNKAFCFVELGRYGEAVEAADLAIDRNPKSFQARNHKGYSLYHLGKREEGKGLVEEVSKTQPDYMFAHIDLARILAGEGDAHGAVSELKAALRHAPVWHGRLVLRSPEFESLHQDPDFVRLFEKAKPAKDE